MNGLRKSPVHLDLTGDQDKIICICGGYQVIPFTISKQLKKNLCLEFTQNLWKRKRNLPKQTAGAYRKIKQIKL
jgi:hypothetical protein